eukprot:342464-Amphidinium_carterae.1
MALWICSCCSRYESCYGFCVYASCMLLGLSVLEVAAGLLVLLQAVALIGGYVVVVVYELRKEVEVGSGSGYPRYKGGQGRGKGGQAPGQFKVMAGAGPQPPQRGGGDKDKPSDKYQTSDQHTPEPAAQGRTHRETGTLEYRQSRCT